MGETAPNSRAGLQVGRYALRRLLGSGATGEVYEAVDSVTEQTVAVKLVASALSQDPTFRDQMQQDAYVVSRLRGPHIVPINDFGEIDGDLFTEMPLIEGADLSALLNHVGALTPARAVNIVRQASAALDSAHALGIIHGNIKPTNILVSEGDTVHLVDFAISSGISDTDAQWKYCAPEIFREAEVDPSIDIYALTGVLYHCLTGSPPYAGQSIEALAAAHLTEPVPRPSHFNSDVPSGFDAVIAKGMAKNPGERYASAGSLDLAAYQALSGSIQSHAGNTADTNSLSALLPAEPPPPTPPSTPAPAPAPQTPPPPPQREQALPAAPTPAAPTPPPIPAVSPPRHLPSPAPAADWNPRGGRPTPMRSAAHEDWRRYSPEPSTLQTFLGDRKRLLSAGAVLVVALGLILWLPNHSQPDDLAVDAGPTQSTSADKSASVATTDAAKARLLKLLPVGYPPNACKSTDPLGGAVAEMSCGKNIEVDAPTAATYTLFPDLGTLRLSFDSTVQTSNVVMCPGNIQSPGAWHRTTSPTKSDGMLLCAFRKNIPTLVWSNDSDLLVGTVQAEPPGASLDQLYAWWSSHS